MPQVAYPPRLSLLLDDLGACHSSVGRLSEWQNDSWSAVALGPTQCRWNVQAGVSERLLHGYDKPFDIARRFLFPSVT